MKAIFIIMSAVFIAFALVGASIFFLPALAGPFCTVFVSLLGVFLAIETAHTIQDTVKLPAGSYQPLFMWRYITGCILLSILFGACVYKRILSPDIDLNACGMSLGVGILGILTMIIGGVQGNKLVTGTPPIAANKDNGQAGISP